MLNYSTFTDTELADELMRIQKPRHLAKINKKAAMIAVLEELQNRELHSVTSSDGTFLAPTCDETGAISIAIIPLGSQGSRVLLRKAKPQLCDFEIQLHKLPTKKPS